MPGLQINFVTSQRHLASPGLSVGLVFLAAGAVALGIATWDYARQTEINDALRAQRDHLAARLQSQMPRKAISPELSARADQAGVAYAQLLTPWREIFQALEAARNTDIALLSLTADATKQEIALSGEARDFAALSGFADTLSSGSMFRRVTVANHKFSEGPPPIVLKFDLVLAWRTTGR